MTGVATARLPPGACRPVFTLDTQNGTDEIACLVERGGWEAVERPLPQYFFRYALKHPGLVLDVGANTGFYTLLAVSAAAGNAVVAFEPLPSVLELLHRNVCDNGVHERVRLIRCAISDRNGRADLLIPIADHGLVETSASLVRDFKPAHSETLPVLSRTLDRVTFRPSLIRRRVTIIKVDVEGHEAAVLAGARWTIARHRPVIFIEVLPRADVAALTGFLHRRRYADVRLLPDGPPLVRDYVAFDPGSWNHALVPREGLFDFLATS